VGNNIIKKLLMGDLVNIWQSSAAGKLYFKPCYPL